MSEWTGLERAALAQGQCGPWAGFPARVADWQAAFAIAGGHDWALYFEDAATFAAALFGAWHAGVRVFLPGDDLPATLDRLAARVDGFAGDLPSACNPLRAQAGRGDANALQPLDAEAARVVMFTSGSTGEPSAIDKCLRQLDCEVAALEAAFGGLVAGCGVYGTVSHQHIYGLLHRVLWPLAAGRETAPRAFFPEDMLASMAGRSAVLVATPAHLKRLPEQLDWEKLHGHLKAVFSSGGPLPEDAAARALHCLGTGPIEVFGSSETGGMAWRRWQGVASDWQPLPGVDWRIADGLLQVRSGHLPDPQAWWSSQDRAEALADGRFRLLGRADRIVKIEERRVSLEALQRDLLVDPLVADARVLALPGNRVVLGAVVVPSDAGWRRLRAGGRRGLAQMLGDGLAVAHDAVARPRRWRFVEALPQDAQGKTTEPALRALFRPVYPPPQWSQREPCRAALALTLDPDLAAFGGHFPGAPILPGVAQLDWAVHFGRQVFAMADEFSAVEVLKFQQVLKPGDAVQLTLEWAPERGALSFRYDSAAGRHASGRVLFSPGAADGR